MKSIRIAIYWLYITIYMYCIYLLLSNDIDTMLNKYQNASHVLLFISCKIRKVLTYLQSNYITCLTAIKYDKYVLTWLGLYTPHLRLNNMSTKWKLAGHTCIPLKFHDQSNRGTLKIYRTFDMPIYSKL